MVAFSMWPSSNRLGPQSRGQILSSPDTWSAPVTRAHRLIPPGQEGIPRPAHWPIPLLLSAALLAASGLHCRPVAAETTFTPSEGLTLRLGLEAGIGGFLSRGTNFGAGRVDLRSGREGGDTSWGEAYLEPKVGVDYALTSAGTLYGGTSAVGALTTGEGDPSGSTRGGDGRVDLETAFVGWRSGPLLIDTLGEDALDLSLGRQEFTVGDGFLISDGHFDRLDDGAYWLAPRSAFQGTGLVRLKTGPVRGDLFYLAADDSQDDTELAGLNLEYAAEGLGTLAALYFQVLDSGTPIVYGPRDGMEVLSLRAAEISPPALPDLAFSGEYVGEAGSGRDGRFDASAWYLKASYARSDWTWSPTLSYRYARFSGDGDPEDQTRRDFEPFFYGYEDWGTWYQGEVTGEYLLFNSNQLSHTLHLSASPSETLGVGALYYSFDLDVPSYFGTPVTSRDFADELNLYLDWTLNEQVTLSLAWGIALPGKAAREVFGDGERFQVLELSLALAF